MKVLHCITGLNRGGAETMLLKLASRLPSMGCECRVVCLLEPGPLAAAFRELGITVDSLGMRRGVPSLRALWRLRSIISRWRPDVVQTWLYHADLMGLVAARLAGNVPVVWNLRCTSMDTTKLSSVLVRRACAMLSGYADGIASNSHTGFSYHRALGYRPRSEWLLPNGFDLQLFASDEKARDRMRKQWGVRQSQRVVGMAARRDSLKDHETLLRAFARVVRDFPDARLVLCGDGMAAGDSAAMNMVRECGVQDGVLLLGPLDDMAGFMNGLDVFCLSSRAEGFPNVLGEAMACGVPCIATDVGDVRRVMGNTGNVLPVGDSVEMAKSIIKLFSATSAQRKSMGRAGRARMEQEYSLEAVASLYMNMYARLRG